MPRPRRTRAALLPLALLLAAAPAGAAAPEPATGPAAGEPPAGSDAGADLLRSFAGVWNATMQIASPDDAPPRVLNGIEVNTVGGGGAWVVSDFTSQLEGRPFQGHAILSWNAAAGRFRRVWADSTSPSFWLSEGAWEAASRTLTLWIETVDARGKPVRWREETVFKDDDTRVFTMYVPGAGSTDAAAINIVYRRRAEGAPPPPLLPLPGPPGPGHALVRRDAGVWSARMRNRMGPGGRTVASKGTETNTLCCGGQFLVTDYIGQAKESPFEGHGLLGYDPAKGRHISAWVDTVDRTLEIHEGDYDEAGGTLTFRFDAPDGHGGVMPMREVLAWDGDRRRTLTFFIPDAGGGEEPGMTITYRRLRAAAPAERR